MLMTRDMVELLLLRNFMETMKNVDDDGLLHDKAGYAYDANALYERHDELAKDFLSPYVVSKPSKEE